MGTDWHWPTRRTRATRACSFGTCPGFWGIMSLMTRSNAVARFLDEVAEVGPWLELGPSALCLRKRRG